MPSPIDEQVVDFFDALFGAIFSEPFSERIPERLKQRAVVRDVEESADAASQSLTRFFLNEQLTEAQVTDVLNGFAVLPDLLVLNDISNPNVTPESVVENLLPELSPPEPVSRTNLEAVYRVALHSIVQVLMLVGPVMAEWRKLNFSSAFELLRRVVNRLNQISEQLDALGRAGQSAMDERYELTYRDYLLQRFHRIEVGTVRMTTNMDVDLRELFVMPRVSAQSLPEEGADAEPTDATGLMDLAVARESFAERREQSESEAEKDNSVLALAQVKRYPHNVIVGLPGSGKSTFLEWLQLKIAAVEEEFVMAGEQAIPLLLRVRQLDAQDLPRGGALIQSATGSKDRADLMPYGWIDRQMRAGRVLFMLDGLDETEPEIRDDYILPWLLKLCQKYPNCQYLVSSRPVGYPPGTLRQLEFAECDLLDFNERQISEYTRHWCTAVRLARNEPEAEARREGENEGNQIVDGFKDHLHIQNLARNPLMLSAVCLVNYFEGGTLPEDRALLYQLCVEGLLHHWDARRGIHSEFGFDEKLRACREVAIVMQADDKAEYPAEKVGGIFADVLGDADRAENLLEHIRYRTGLLLERRPQVFAFAHLTFQEYLAARAVHEGNRCGVDVERLVHEHNDGRWQEVIALYCGLAPTPAARDLIEQLTVREDTKSLSTVLAEAYLSAGAEMAQDREFRRQVLERIAIAPGTGFALDRFHQDEVAPIANLCVGKIESEISESYRWLIGRLQLLDVDILVKRLRLWQTMNPFQIAELVCLLHAGCPDPLLAKIAADAGVYAAAGPKHGNIDYGSQAVIALIGLCMRKIQGLPKSAGVSQAFLQILRTLSKTQNLPLSVEFYDAVLTFLNRPKKKTRRPKDPATWPEFVALARRLASQLMTIDDTNSADKKNVINVINVLHAWAEGLEKAITDMNRLQSKSARLVQKTKKKSPKRK